MYLYTYILIIINVYKYGRYFIQAKLMISIYSFVISDFILSKGTVLTTLHFRNAVNSEECAFRMNVILLGFQWSWVIVSVCVCACVTKTKDIICF